MRKGALAVSLVEADRSRDKVYCPACRSDRMYRMDRRGILQKNVFPFFGLFPWQCKNCQAEAMLRKRKRRHRKPTGA
jgi:hypothetical protein